MTSLCSRGPTKVFLESPTLACYSFLCILCATNELEDYMRWLLPVMSEVFVEVSPLSAATGLKRNCSLTAVGSLKVSVDLPHS